jgi:hypothetical protein
MWEVMRVFCRKKVQDFYQRTSLTAYCTAFAYRPLTRGVNSQLSQVYLELPADSKHLYVPHRSPTPLAWDFRNILDPHCKGMPGHFHSTGACSCYIESDSTAFPSWMLHFTNGLIFQKSYFGWMKECFRNTVLRIVFPLTIRNFKFNTNPVL